MPVLPPLYHLSIIHDLGIHGIFTLYYFYTITKVLLSDYRSYEELRLTKGCREVTEEDERQAEILCQSFRERWKEEEK